MNEMNTLEARMNCDFDCFLCSFCRLEWLTIISWSLGDLFIKKLRHPIFISEFWGFRVQGRLWQNKIPMTCSEPLDHCSDEWCCFANPEQTFGVAGWVKGWDTQSVEMTKRWAGERCMPFFQNGISMFRIWSNDCKLYLKTKGPGRKLFTVSFLNT